MSSIFNLRRRRKATLRMNLAVKWMGIANPTAFLTQTPLALCQILRTLAYQSGRKCSAQVVNLIEKLHNRLNENIEPNFYGKREVILTNELVHTTLLHCPSDLVALSFFLWCAKQANFFHNAAGFDYMVSVVSRLMKRYETVPGILGGLESVGNVTKAQTFLLLLRIYWRGGMYELVFEAFDHMGHYGFTPNTFARNVIMDVLFKAGRTDVALKVFKETLLPNFLTFNIVLRNLSEIKDLIGIRDAFRCMLRMGYYPNPGTFEVVLNCYCKLGRLAEAYQVLGIITTFGISMSVNIWTIIVDGFCRLHRIADASSLMKKMEKTGCSPNIVTYTTLIKGHMDAQLVSDAFGVLSIIESKGHSLDRVLYNVLIDSLAKIGRYDEALSIFLSLDKQNIFPDSYTFSSLLNTICLSKRFFLLPKLVDGFFIEVDLVACNSLLSYLGKAGFPSLALELYDEMLDKGLMPDKYSVLGVLTGLCGSRRIDEAVCLYNGILLNYAGVDAHIHTVIIDGLIKAGKCHSAIRVFRKILLEENSLDVISYTVAIRGLLMIGRDTGQWMSLSHAYDKSDITFLFPSETREENKPSPFRSFFLRSLFNVFSSPETQNASPHPQRSFFFFLLIPSASQQSSPIPIFSASMRCKNHLSDATSAVGVCASCLRDRLFSLMAAQARAQAQAQEPHLSRLRSSAEDLPRKSDPHPPPLVFPRSVSPYVSRRKVEDSSWNFPSPLDDRHRRFHHRFYSTPQVGPTHYGRSDKTTFVTTGSVSRKQRGRFSLWSRLFRSRSDELDSVPRDSSHSSCGPVSSSSSSAAAAYSSSSSSWLSSMFSGRKKKPSKLCSIEEASVDQRKKPSRFFSRGMSPAGGAGEPDGDYDDRRDGSPSASGYSSESSKWKPSPATSHGSTTRRGRQGLSRNVSGLAFCLSPLVRASPNRHWNQKGLPPELTYSGDVRVQPKPHLSEAASFCANRSRKLADFGRVNANR